MIEGDAVGLADGLSLGSSARTPTLHRSASSRSARLICGRFRELGGLKGLTCCEYIFFLMSKLPSVCGTSKWDSRAPGFPGSLDAEQAEVRFPARTRRANVHRRGRFPSPSRPPIFGRFLSTRRRPRLFPPAVFRSWPSSCSACPRRRLCSSASPPSRRCTSGASVGDGPARSALACSPGGPRQRHLPPPPPSRLPRLVPRLQVSHPAGPQIRRGGGPEVRSRNGKVARREGERAPVYPTRY